MQRLLPTVCPVHLRRFIQVLVDIGNCRQINDHAEPEALPEIGYDRYLPEHPRLSQKKYPFHAKLCQETVYNAVKAEDIPQHPRHRNPGKEVGQIHKRLYPFFQPRMMDFIEQKPHNNRNDKTQDDFAHGNNQRIDDCLIGLLKGKNLPEIFQSHEFGIQNPQPGLIILECHHQAAHRCIAENNSQNNAWQKQQIKRPAVIKFLFPASARRRHSSAALCFR
jgi:hypothetical protein